VNSDYMSKENISFASRMIVPGDISPVRSRVNGEEQDQPVDLGIICLLLEATNLMFITSQLF
jgi:hypothetical protein